MLIDPFFLQTKNAPRKTLRRANLPAVPLKLRLFCAPSDSNKSYPLTRADGRSLLRFSVLRLGRDGSFGSKPPVRTNHRLSADRKTRPSSSTPFSYCPHSTMFAPKSQVFLQAEHIFMQTHNNGKKSEGEFVQNVCGDTWSLRWSGAGRQVYTKQVQVF